MFNETFYPTPPEVIDLMFSGIDIEGRTILEPSAGKGDIIDKLHEAGAKAVLSCEINDNLAEIIKTKSQFLTPDFLSLTSERISHINAVIMNPPFNKGAEHILHAFNIAPAGCDIIALCNLETVKNPYSMQRKELVAIIQENGNFTDIGAVFQGAERSTGVNTALIRLKKKGESYNQEFEGFFLDDEPEAITGEGMMKYDAIRDIVNRYVEAVKLFDKQMQDGATMQTLTGSFYKGKICFRIDMEYQAATRERFKQELQKDAWTYIIGKQDLRKYATRGVKEDINKFVENQQTVPFTMKNIYRMFEIIIGTASGRMDKAILEAFDTITAHHHENRKYLKGFKTNSHFLVGKKFILPNVVRPAKEYGYTSDTYNYIGSYKSEAITDLEKAICFTNGLKYDEIQTLSQSIQRNTYTEWYECEFFKYKAFKNGNMHFEWKIEDVLGKFNQQVSRLKGYPIFEAKEQTAYQKRQTGQKEPRKTANPVENILFSFNI